MSNTKEAMRKMLEEKRNKTKQQGIPKKADKYLDGKPQTNASQRSTRSMVNKSI